MGFKSDKTQDEILKEVLTLLSISDNETEKNVVSSIIPNAFLYACEYCGIESVPSHLLIQMTLEDYSKITSAGLTKRSLSSLSEEYLDNYSPKVMAILDKLRGEKRLICL
ncbi:MAG: hypothetical protein J6B60_03220 [Clostridia bacterium]|nr:hypothetical protein [Clostridia bacterium]MBO5416048.1 hypothetical protein [Clostridia bacterium]